MKTENLACCLPTWLWDLQRKSKQKDHEKNIQQHEYDRGHLAPTVRAWAARRSIQDTQGRYSPTWIFLTRIFCPYSKRYIFIMTKKATSILPFPVHFLLSSFALSLQPRLVTSKIRAKHDPTLKYMTNVVDFGQYSNNKIQRAVLPRTESGYSDTLRIFDK